MVSIINSLGGIYMGNFNNNCNCNNNNNNNSLLHELHRHLGETVTIFTTSGGASGCGFTGVLLMVNPCFIRLMVRQGTAPANPLSESICGDMYQGGMQDYRSNGMSGGMPEYHPPIYTVGSVCDIPVEKIASFCHNAV
jgi:hypothetical protein